MHGLACMEAAWKGRLDSGPHQDTPVEASATMTPRVASIAHLQDWMYIDHLVDPQLKTTGLHHFHPQLQ